MNKNVESVSALAKHIVSEILLNRLEQSSPNALTFKELIHNQRYFDELAQNTINGIFYYYRNSSSFDEILGEVIVTTLQDHDTEYGKALKSRIGFWSNMFNVNSARPVEDFGKSFSFYIFRSFQSEERNISRQRKKMLLLNDAEDPDSEESSGMDFADDRETDEKTKNMNLFEDKLNKMLLYVESSKDFDEIDRMIFREWFSKKGDGNFLNYVKMLNDVFMPVIVQLESMGKKITLSALYARWKHIQLFLKDHILSN